MSVYTDGIHLTSIDLEELHAFAKGIGLKRKWFQDKRLPHYDLTTQAMVNKAIQAGAIPVKSRQLVRLWQEK